MLHGGSARATRNPMHDLTLIKAAVARDPLPFLSALYGDTVRGAGTLQWRVGSRGGKAFDTRQGELLACDFTGDGESGDIFAVWQAHTGQSFKDAVAAVAGLYGVNADTIQSPHRTLPRVARADPEAKLDTRPLAWPTLDARHDALWEDGVARLIENAAFRERIAEWRGWPPIALVQLAKARLIGATDFDLWPSRIATQPCALFRVLHPHGGCESDGGREFFSQRPAQIHVRFAAKDATTRDGRPLSWIYVPTMKALGVGDGGNAPLMIARDGRDPEQPGWRTRCQCVIMCAGEWDAITTLLAGEWLDANGTLTLPPGLAIVGIRGEGRGGTDAYFRFYQHWRPRSVIMLADADKTGATWFESNDGRPCFAGQIERRGAKTLRFTPSEHKDINDIYRAGNFGLKQVEAMLSRAGFPLPKGDRQ